MRIFHLHCELFLLDMCFGIWYLQWNASSDPLLTVYTHTHTLSYTTLKSHTWVDWRWLSIWFLLLFWLLLLLLLLFLPFNSKLQCLCFPNGNGIFISSYTYWWLMLMHGVRCFCCCYFCHLLWAMSFDELFTFNLCSFFTRQSLLIKRCMLEVMRECDCERRLRLRGGDE